MNLIDLWRPRIPQIPNTARKIIRWNDDGVLRVTSATLAETEAAKRRAIAETTILGLRVTKKRMETLRSLVSALDGITEDNAVSMSYFVTQHPFNRWARNKIVDDLRLMAKAGLVGTKRDGKKGWWKYWALDKPK